MTTTIGEKYLCEICKNRVQVINMGRGVLVCCNRPMVKCDDNSEEK